MQSENSLNLAQHQVKFQLANLNGNENLLKKRVIHVYFKNYPSEFNKRYYSPQTFEDLK